MEEEYVFVLDFNGEEFIITKKPYEEVGLRESYLDSYENVIRRKEKDGDVILIDLDTLDFDVEVNLIDLI
jgi:hypothetical protein